MKLKTTYLVLKTKKPVEEDASKLRGYIGRRFSEYPILHHHLGSVSYIYSYPRVQYKVFGGTPSILGIEEGGEVLKEISGNLSELLLGPNAYELNQKVIFEQESEFGLSTDYMHYKFLTPWNALNQENYTRYKRLRYWSEKKEFLNSIITGNVLSMCKGLAIEIRGEIYVHCKVDECIVRYKGIPVTGFLGEFDINFIIPDFFGLGKGVSEGFGVIKGIKDDDDT